MNRPCLPIILNKPVIRADIIPWICLFLLFLFQVSTANAQSPIRGGTLHVGLENDFTGFDPFKAWAPGPSGASLVNAVLERLFDMDEEGNLVPLLGLSAETSKDGLAWTIRLRRGVKFHDGTPFNADAVVGYWSKMLDPKTHFRYRSGIEVIQSVEKLDDHTVRFNLKHVWPPFPGAISSLLGWVSYVPSPTALRNRAHNRAPIGTGPFIFKEWNPGDKLVFVRNPDYWNKDRPYLDKIVFRPLPDHQTRYASLKSGELDIIWTDRGSHILEAQKDSNLKVMPKDENGSEIIVMHCGKPPFNDPRVRKALAHAWNQDLLLKVVYKDTLPAVQHPFGPDFQCDMDLEYPEYNPEKAKKLLAEYGRPVEFEFQFTNTLRGREHGQILRDLCNKVGMKVNLAPRDIPTAVKKYFTGDFEVTTWRTPSTFDLGPYLYARLHSKSGGNNIQYNNPEMDGLLDEMRQAPDRETRRKIQCRVARLINRDAVYIYRGGRRYHVLSSPKVKGFAAPKYGVMDLKDVWLKEQ